MTYFVQSLISLTVFSWNLKNLSPIDAEIRTALRAAINVLELKWCSEPLLCIPCNFSVKTSVNVQKCCHKIQSRFSPSQITAVAAHLVTSKMSYVEVNLDVTLKLNLQFLFPHPAV